MSRCLGKAGVILIDSFVARKELVMRRSKAVAQLAGALQRLITGGTRLLFSDTELAEN